MSRALLFLLLFVSLFLTACASEDQTLPLIRLGYAPHDHHASLYLAAQLSDHFRQQGGLYLREVRAKEHYQLIDQGQAIADVMVVRCTGGGQIIRKLHEKQLDVSFGPVPAMIQRIDAGSDLKIVAPVMSNGAALVMAKDFPADDWPSFIAAVKQAPQPVRIGYKFHNSVQSLVFEQTLDYEGISFSHDVSIHTVQVVVRNLFGSQNLIPALKNGLIDGFVIMQPVVALAEYQQVGKVVSFLHDFPPAGQWQGLPCCALAANGPVLSQQPLALSKLVTLLSRANRYVQEHPRKSAALIAHWLGTPFAVEERSIPTIKYLDDFSPEWHRGVDQWMTNMAKQGQLSGTLKTALADGTAKTLLYDQSFFDYTRMQVGAQ